MFFTVLLEFDLKSLQQGLVFGERINSFCVAFPFNLFDRLIVSNTVKHSLDLLPLLRCVHSFPLEIVTAEL